MKKVFLIILIVLSFTGLSTANNELEVVDLDNKTRGVCCKIFKVALDGKETPIGETDENGVYNEKINCDKGFRIKFYPMNQNYYFSLKKCPIKTKRIEVVRISYVKILQKNAKIAIDLKDPATASLIFNEIAARARIYDDTELSKSAEKNTIKFAAESLGFKNALKYDPLQGKNVITPEFSKKLKLYQDRNNIKATGDLDYKTLKTISGKNISAYIYSVKEKL